MAIVVIEIDSNQENQRIDNYLIKICKGVPKTRVYRALRKGEVRINQKRVKPDYRLMPGDKLRLPPFRQASDTEKVTQPTSLALLNRVEQAILQENQQFIIIDKPSGIPVHGGTGIKTGLIEAIRELRPNCRFLELVHRLDRETSGCLVIAKKRSFLLRMHHLLLHRQVNKRYWALLRGRVADGEQKISAPLQKNQQVSGERIVIVSEEGKPATTILRPLRYFEGATLVEVQPITGRTHQIRVHAAHIGHPVAGDEKYGDREFNKYLRKKGLTRLFLHSASIYCRLADDPPAYLGLCAPLGRDLTALLQQLGQPTTIPNSR